MRSSRYSATADADEKVRVVVLRANGKHFCSGADVGSLAERRAKGEKRVAGADPANNERRSELVASVLDCGKPVFAAVHGAATGMGAHVVYASDLVIATENAYFAESFVKRGLVVDGGGCYLLPRRIGMQKAKEMAFFGEKLSAAEALPWDWSTGLVAPTDFDATVAEFAGRLAGRDEFRDRAHQTTTQRLPRYRPRPAHSSPKRWRRRSNRIRRTLARESRHSSRSAPPSSPAGDRKIRSHQR